MCPLSIKEIKERRRIVCICRAIPMFRIRDALRLPDCRTVEDVNRITGCGRGDCGGKRCRPVIEEVLQEASQSIDLTS